MRGGVDVIFQSNRGAGATTAINIAIASMIDHKVLQPQVRPAIVSSVAALCLDTVCCFGVDCHRLCYTLNACDVP